MYGNYFKFEELVSTQTGLPNSVLTDSHLANLASLWNYLNYLRKELGQPIFINSAYRTPAVNKQVGGSKRSYHMQGRAADIRTNPEYMADLWKILQREKEEHYIIELKKYDTRYHIAL